jgi:addiction module HigA family antidote
MATLRSLKRKPTHPGAILREDVLPELEMSQREIAEALGISRRAISQILNERKSINADTAIRLAKFLGGTPDCWLKMQTALDIWELQQQNVNDYKSILCVKNIA